MNRTMLVLTAAAILASAGCSNKDLIAQKDAQILDLQNNVAQLQADVDEQKRMNADLDRDVFLGERANEQNVKTADLTRYRVIAFATHGLVPGDLDGLTQPALALTAPPRTRKPTGTVSGTGVASDTSFVSSIQGTSR